MKQGLILAFAILLAACGTESNTQGTETTGSSEPPMPPGKKIFINNCVQCHNVKTDKIGPKLEGSFANWNNDTARFFAFVRNSQEVIKAGDPRAVEVYEKWGKQLMTPMPHLTDGDMKDLLEYINKGEE
jgi:cytochrome c551/c552